MMFADKYELYKHKLTHPNFVAKFYRRKKLHRFKCHYCGQRFKSESSLISHELSHERSHEHSRECLVVVDLHGLYFSEAKLEVKEVLFEANKLGYKEIKLIHGYRHGHALRDYFRSDDFIREMKNLGFIIGLTRTANPGTTAFAFRFINKTYLKKKITP